MDARYFIKHKQFTALSPSLLFILQSTNLIVYKSSIFWECFLLLFNFFKITKLARIEMICRRTPDRATRTGNTRSSRAYESPVVCTCVVQKRFIDCCRRRFAVWPEGGWKEFPHTLSLAELPLTRRIRCQPRFLRKKSRSSTSCDGFSEKHRHSL